MAPHSTDMVPLPHYMDMEEWDPVTPRARAAAQRRPNPMFHASNLSSSLAYQPLPAEAYSASSVRSDTLSPQTVLSSSPGVGVDHVSPPEALLDAFSEAERRVLQHAADILNVPFTQITSLRQHFPASSSPDSARPRQAQRRTDEEWPWGSQEIADIANIATSPCPPVPNVHLIPSPDWPVDATTASWHSDIPAPGSTPVPNLHLQNGFEVPDSQLDEIFADNPSGSRSTFVSGNHAQDAFQVPKEHSDDSFLNNFSAFDSTFPIDIRVPCVSKVPEISLDEMFTNKPLAPVFAPVPDLKMQNSMGDLRYSPNNIAADNSTYPMPQTGPYYEHHEPRFSIESSFPGRGDQDMANGNSFCPTLKEVACSQSSFIEPVPVFHSAVMDVEVVNNMPPREESIRVPVEAHWAGVIPTRPSQQQTLEKRSSQERAGRLTIRPLHPSPESRRSDINRGLKPASRDRRCNTGSEIRKAKRQGPLPPDKRIETSHTRKANACVRCHMQRSRCLPNPDDPFGCCLTCSQLSRRMITKIPCLRYKISDSQLLDKGTHPRFSWTRRWTSMKIVEIDAWKSDELKIITLTQDVGGAEYSLQVREFLPLEGDALARTWNSRDGTRSHPCAPYAIADMRAMGNILVKFVDSNIGTFISHYINKNDHLMYQTYEMAHRGSVQAETMQERSLLKAVLRLWVASRMESKQERICSKEVLGMTPQTWDPEAGNFGKYLVPPVMQAQIEILTTSLVLLPMKQAVLKDLQHLVEKSQVRSWFTIYLCTFILLHSCALLTHAEAVRAAREGLLGSNSRYHNHQLVEEFHNGARTMLAYFHYCNKGSHPFTIDWANQTNLTFAHLDAEQAKFMQKTKAEIEQRGDHFRYIKRNKIFEDDYYFVSQLYELNWTPTHTV